MISDVTTKELERLIFLTKKHMEAYAKMPGNDPVYLLEQEGLIADIEFELERPKEVSRKAIKFLPPDLISPAYSGPHQSKLK